MVQGGRLLGFHRPRYLFDIRLFVRAYDKYAEGILKTTITRLFSMHEFVEIEFALNYQSRQIQLWSDKVKYVACIIDSRKRRTKPQLARCQTLKGRKKQLARGDRTAFFKSLVAHIALAIINGNKLIEAFDIFTISAVMKNAMPRQIWHLGSVTVVLTGLYLSSNR